MIKGLGASYFIHNAIEYDYCLTESVISVVPICEEIVILDAGSTDGTVELIKDIASKWPNVRSFFGADWECGNDFSRLQKLATEAKNKLSDNIKWHLMMQADEVLHEKSYEGLELAVVHGNTHPHINGYRVYRFHIYGDFDHMVSLTAPSNRKPAGDWIIRLGRKELPIVGDAENLADIAITDRFANRLILFHYGYMRKSDEMLKKGIDMTMWFGGNIEPDKRLMDMQKSGRGWKPYEIMGKDLLETIRMAHPQVMSKWIEERKKYY